MGTGRIRAGLLASLIAMGVAAHAADGPSNGFASALLAEHNSERDRAGVPRLVWSGKLAHEAHQWAEVLARENTMRHAPRDISRGAGENLWMGAAGYYGPDKMVGAFVDEKRVFVHGTFPKVSTTGRWQDVGHYTQVVWRDTKEVGCAIARGEAYDFLVCRYWPAGNWIGQVPF